MELGSHPSETRRRYDETADLYDQRYSEIQRQKYAILLSMLQPREGESVLDWGCGTGLARSHLEATGVRYFGIDFSLGMLSVHRRRGRSKLVLGDCARLPFCDGIFDGIFGATVLQNIPDHSKAFREIRRVLKPGGRAVLSILAKAKLNHEAVRAAGLEVTSVSECGEDIAVCLVRTR